MKKVLAILFASLHRNRRAKVLSAIMPPDEAIKFLESLARQAEYRRTQKGADPVVASEAIALELYIKERTHALRTAVARKPASVSPR